MKRLLFPGLIALLLLPTAPRAEVLLPSIINILVDGGNNYTWQKVELPGTVCGNGSQYKFFIRRTSSPNLLFLFEGGGACWDYDTCSGRAGVLGAANPNGITNDYMTQFTAKYVSPIVNGADPGLPLRSKTDLVTKDWNIVYMPYCTGDVHVGNNTATYTDQTGANPPLVWRHNGYANTIAAANYARTQFPSVQKLLVTGFSAGGAATSSAYYFVRRAINPARGYLLNDSGPIFLAPNVNDLSRALHTQIRQSWNLNSVFSLLPGSFDQNNFGSINRMVATEFPNDQLAYTGYTRDYNYSRFSYERFRTPNDQASIHNYWKVDQDRLVAELNLYNNFSYFIPYHRPINSSHCSTVITFIGAHACQRMEKKKYWWEYLEWPPGQTYKCYSEFVGMDVFLKRFINDNQRVRIYEPANGYNNEDPGMSAVAALINGALGG
ncbi:pectin acetylesterase-family hydrolase [Hyalangium sp.]|uniref:pectin acetylesterase-family hydrolase n=1 Tax=Hyalangium sp. TaxID=2028555 RepID=UPI002D461E60|nr:pectin acetylesterase-family hydrolase [Hyalangium sp.]HYI00103.1 pectin acetylesterase-family hydrolase [Hyalangium sp.]